jgi:acetyl-CoA synthetase
LWNEPERFIQSYWSQFPGCWVHGDRAIRYEDGSFEVPGRSDDVLKVAGKRIGPSEMETLAGEIPGVTSAAAIGVPHPTKGDVAVLVLTVDSDHKDDDTLTGSVADRIEGSFGRPLRPAAVLVLDELPLTGSGKVHRRALRGWMTRQDPGDLSTVANPEVKTDILAGAERLASILEASGR